MSVRDRSLFDGISSRAQVQNRESHVSKFMSTCFAIFLTCYQMYIYLMQKLIEPFGEIRSSPVVVSS
jgi:hypothetical protein